MSSDARVAYPYHTESVQFWTALPADTEALFRPEPATPAKEPQ